MNAQTFRAFKEARSINSARLFVLLSCVGVLSLVRMVAYPVPDAAFVMFALWMLAGLLYDFGMTKIARVIPARAMQAVMFVLDITLLTAVVAVA